MDIKEQALDRAMKFSVTLDEMQEDLETVRSEFATACHEAHEAGVSDRVIASETGFSRARIQQLRNSVKERK